MFGLSKRTTRNKPLKVNTGKQKLENYCIQLILKDSQKRMSTEIKETEGPETKGNSNRTRETVYWHSTNRPSRPHEVSNKLEYRAGYKSRLYKLIINM